jgi:lysophospholipase L1-like esterase
MKTVAARFGIPLANLQSWLDADGNRDSGFLWWDGVHLTSWGQALAADFIHQNLPPLR